MANVTAAEREWLRTQAQWTDGAIDTAPQDIADDALMGFYGTSSDVFGDVTTTPAIETWLVELATDPVEAFDVETSVFVAELEAQSRELAGIAGAAGAAVAGIATAGISPLLPWIAAAAAVWFLVLKR